jgi:hypothetical protein
MARFSLLAALCLAGCVTAPAPAPLHVCPVIPTYSKAFEQQAAAELAALPPGDPLGKLVGDYLVIRDEVRDCR